MCEEESVEYLRDLIREQEEVDKSGKDILGKLLSQEIVRVRGGGRPPGKDTRLLDVYNEKPVKVTAKVMVPVKEHPKFNFVGKLLGPRGSSLKGLQEETMTKMAVLGKGSMKDKLKEQQLRNSPDPKHSHLQEDLHVEITAFSSPAEAHARIAYALSCVRKYMIPDSNDQIRQNQMREIQILKKLETSEDIVSDAINVSKDSGNESDASISPPPNNTSPSPSLQQTNSSSTHSLLLNNNSLPLSQAPSHSHPNGSHSQNHPGFSLSHSHPNTSHPQSHPNSTLSLSHPNNPHSHIHTNSSHPQSHPNSSHPHSHPNSSHSHNQPKYTSILNKVTIQKYTHEEEQVGGSPTVQHAQPYCCDQIKTMTSQPKTNILDKILPGFISQNKRDHTVSMDYEYTHPDYFLSEEPVTKKCK